MIRQLLFGTLVSLCNIMIHAMVMSLVVHVVKNVVARPSRSPMLFLCGVMVATVSVLMLAHVAEVFVWAAAYAFVGAAPEGADVIYFAFVNYTTLGYGDVLPEKAWRLLGPLTAANGVILFGWSTAVIFDVLKRTIDIPARR